ncbi:MAG TPA: hypothetical protein VM582_06375, partial [Candidatus Thermoplasmatota archaeon]|nr:hypothetical protein [Candidatus Thermoplasmatota archaeon]
MNTSHAVRCLALVALLLGSSFAALAQVPEAGPSGRRVSFDLVRFEDTVFVAIEGSLRARFDADGHVWYTT